MPVSRMGLVLALLVLPATAFGQNCNLSEAPKNGECFRITIATTLNGTMKAVQDGKEIPVKLTAKNDHAILERVLHVDKGTVRKSARWYDKSNCDAEIGEQRVQRSLRDDRQLIVAQRPADDLLCYSPAGPLTRTELEVASEHFDTLAITNLLPGKEVMVGETWKIAPATAQALCLFDGLIEHDLTGKLIQVKDGQAVVGIEGKASGIELGAAVKLNVKATLLFDILQGRIVHLEWGQKDVRDQGPASPASDVESKTIVKRTLLSEEPKELSKTALVGVPSEDDPPELLKLLQHKESTNRYSFLYSRDWHIVGQTEHHLVLRLLERGDFIGQATVTSWRKESPGKHVSIDDFKQRIGEGWTMEEIVDSGEVPTDDGRWIYRVTAKGELEGGKVVQTFIVHAGPQGDQVVVTFTMKPANAAKIGTRDLQLVNSIEFPKK